MQGSRERGLGHHVGDLTGSPWLTPRHLRIVKVAAPILIFLVAGLWVFAPGGDAPVRSVEPVPLHSPVVHDASEPVEEAPPTPKGWTGYAVALDELEGLPPDASPGTEMDLWVMWQPPITESPKAQLLIEDVVLEKIVPAITPDGPDAAVLLLPHKKTREILYGDEYGALSVTLKR